MSVSSSVAAKPSTSSCGRRRMKPDCVRDEVPPSVVLERARVVGSSVSNSLSSMDASAPVSAFSSVDLPTFV